MPFDPNTGMPMGTPQEPPPPAAKSTNVVAVVGLVAGILGLVTSPIPFLSFGAVLIAAVGLVLSIMGRKKASAGGDGGGVAMAGIVVSILALLVSLTFSLMCAMCAAGGHKMGKDLSFEIEKSQRELDKDVKAWQREMEKAPTPPSAPDRDQPSGGTK